MDRRLSGLPLTSNFNEQHAQPSAPRRPADSVCAAERACRRQRADGAAPRGGVWDQRRDVAQHADEPRSLACAKTPAASPANLRIEQGCLRASHSAQDSRPLGYSRAGGGRPGLSPTRSRSKLKTCKAIALSQPHRDRTVSPRPTPHRLPAPDLSQPDACPACADWRHDVRQWPGEAHRQREGR